MLFLMMDDADVITALFEAAFQGVGLVAARDGPIVLPVGQTITNHVAAGVMDDIGLISPTSLKSGIIARFFKAREGPFPPSEHPVLDVVMMMHIGGLSRHGRQQAH